MKKLEVKKGEVTFVVELTSDEVICVEAALDCLRDEEAPKPYFGMYDQRYTDELVQDTHRAFSHLRDEVA